MSISDIRTRLVTNQPQAILDLESQYSSSPSHEKNFEASFEDNHHDHCEHGQTSYSEHHDYRNIRLQQETKLLRLAMLVLLFLEGLLAWSLYASLRFRHDLPNRQSDHLVGRAVHFGSLKGLTCNVFAPQYR